MCRGRAGKSAARTACPASAPAITAAAAMSRPVPVGTCARLSQFDDAGSAANSADEEQRAGGQVDGVVEREEDDDAAEAERRHGQRGDERAGGTQRKPEKSIAERREGGPSARLSWLGASMSSSPRATRVS